jgi:hypothetical protein
MENKQTTIDWLNTNLIHTPQSQEDFRYNEETFVRAKIMEKEQIKDAFTDGCIGELYELNAYYTSEKYYNETYGTN